MHRLVATYYKKMKKNQFNLLFTLLFSLVAFSQTKNIAVNLDIRGRDCNGGLGLCNISKSIEKSSSNATLYTNNIGELVIDINYSKIPQQELINLLGEPLQTTKTTYTFTLEADFPIIEEIHKMLFITEVKSKIPKGNYPAIIIGTILSIKMPLVLDN